MANSNVPMEIKGLVMAVLLRGGADITELSEKLRKKINGYIHQLEQEIRDNDWANVGSVNAL
ncbi:hypothetical protein Q9L58_001930 [Maublancomyces gigas]|uniref:Uncharacterized protein n=1 Tax=Discina gigas TaxID=1032678 RepID=A0ABR3GT68_9PEZI